jgi:hypothetical protein
MAKRLTEAQRKEAERLRDWSLKLIELLDFPEPIKSMAATTFGEACQKGDLRALRRGARDFVSAAEGLSPAAKREIEEILQASFGMGLKEALSDSKDKLAKILTRGEIGSDEEYQLIKERLDQIAGEAAFTDESNALTQLIERDLAPRLKK